MTEIKDEERRDKQGEFEGENGDIKKGRRSVGKVGRKVKGRRMLS